MDGSDFPADAGPFVVDLDGFEGPIDALLTLARQQKVDLRHISIVELADQYLAFIALRRRVNLTVSAEYLVMAAWLAYLKSRLMLPEPATDDEPEPEVLAEALRMHLARLDAFRSAATRLAARPRLGVDTFGRGRPEGFPVDRSVLKVPSLHALLKAYGAHLVRQSGPEAMVIATSPLWTVEQAIERLTRALGVTGSWRNLFAYLPAETWDGIRAVRVADRSAVAATLVAGLELARQGTIRLCQTRPFGPVFIRTAGPPETTS